MHGCNRTIDPTELRWLQIPNVTMPMLNVWAKAVNYSPNVKRRVATHQNIPAALAKSVEAARCNAPGTPRRHMQTTTPVPLAVLDVEVEAIY